MVSRIETGFRKGIFDPRGASVAKSVRGFLGLEVEAVVTRDVFKIDAPLTREQVDEVAREFTDPVSQEYSLTTLDPAGFDWLIVVGYRPGVTDNVGRSARVAIEDLTGRKFGPADGVYTERVFCIRGGISGADASRIASELLSNGLIETARVVPGSEGSSLGLDIAVPAVASESKPGVGLINLDVDDAELTRISRDGLLSLSLAEMKAIQAHFRDKAVIAAREAAGFPAAPTDAELECLAQTWSEHCKHKIFNAEIEYREPGSKPARILSLFDTYIRASTREISKRCNWLVSVFSDNAGVIRFNDDLNIVYKVETHNSPSALDPYGGSMTGIVGVNRDPFGTGMGAALLINSWGYCLADPYYAGRIPDGLLHPRRIRDGVHKGVIDGGNQSGIPYGCGFEYFDDRYLGKPLVYCGTVGVMPVLIRGEPSHVKKVTPGDMIVMVGGRIGKDGIHGATFSSEELHGKSPAQAVQIGNPVVQKMMTDFLLEARDLGLYSGITDNGAGGLSSSVGEMARQPGGARIDLSKAPLKYAGLDPWEVLLSEAQERMTVAVPPGSWDAFESLSKRRDVEATALGEFTDSGIFHATWGDMPVALLPMEFLHDGVPRMSLKARWTPPRGLDPVRESSGFGTRLSKMLCSLNLCSIEEKSRQYDHEVKGRTVVKPFVGARRDVPSDACVFTVELGRHEGVVLSRGINPSLSDVDTYAMTLAVVDEAVRRIVATGGRTDHIAGLDNFCWPDPVRSEKTPDGEYKLAQLVRSNRALYEVTVAYGVPLISGKDSMKNDSTRGGVKISVPPTLLFSAIGKIDDVRRAVTLDVKSPGDIVYVLGNTGPELGGSEYFRQLSREQGDSSAIGSAAPVLNPRKAFSMYKALERAIAADIVLSCHAIVKGGLAVALSMKALAGDLGIDADLSAAPGAQKIDQDQILFAESNARFVATVAPGRAGDFETAMAGFPAARVGLVNASGRLLLRSGGMTLVDESLDALRSAWKSPLAGC